MKVSIFMIFGLLFLFNGCAYYNINPVYNEKEKTLEINKLKLNNVTKDYTRNGAPGTRGSFSSTQSSYFINDDSCKVLQFSEIHTTSRNAYIVNNTDSDVKLRYTVEDNGHCDVTQISNVKFFKCIPSNNRIKYYIGTSRNNDHGFDQVSRITTNQKCFDKILTHIKQDALKNDVNIKTYFYTGNKEKVYDKDKKYEGSFTLDDNNPNCPKTGKVIATIENDYKIVGITKFTFKGEEHSRKLSGTIKSNRFSGETERLRFYGDYKTNQEFIEGEYFNRTCKGKFNIRLVKN